jgi:hypothetical protein
VKTGISDISTGPIMHHVGCVDGKQARTHILLTGCSIQPVPKTNDSMELSFLPLNERQDTRDFTFAPGLKKVVDTDYLALYQDESLEH